MAALWVSAALAAGCAGGRGEESGGPGPTGGSTDLARARESERHLQEQTRIGVDASHRDWQQWYQYYLDQGHPPDEAALLARRAAQRP